ncbi:polyprenyl synthetase family protein, partial [Endobacter medicaginis]|nr:polyprenyl synthetase family protein [Endobacter medicaginis]
RAEALRLAQAAVAHLGSFGPEADALRALAVHMVERKS